MDSYRHSVSGKRILLTGGTTGIGKATLELLVGEGAHIVTFSRNPENIMDALQVAQSEARAAVHGLVADITQPADVNEVFKTVDAELGGLDVFISNAALGADPVHDMPETEWRYVVETNLIGAMACAREAIDRMKQGEGGHLVFVSSIATDIKKPGESLYAATKAGISAMAETLRKELQEENIKVSVIQPGSVRTPMQECSDDEKDQAVAGHEMLEPEDIAEAIHFALTRPPRADVVNLRIEPVKQKTS